MCGGAALGGCQFCWFSQASRFEVALRGGGATTAAGVCGSAEVLSVLVDCVEVMVCVASGESLAGDCRPAAAVPVGVAILLGGAVVLCATSTSGSSSSGESLDPTGLGNDVVPTAFPPLGRCFEDRGSFFVLPLGWTYTASRLAGAQPVMRGVGVATRAKSTMVARGAGLRLVLLMSAVRCAYGCAYVCFSL